ncbi:Ig-like domain-containing protein, partial [Piscinibacter defluvii]|uniref:Ig-like domain-containing protein n=1 Tax=Piscinibacter defluvii TaxID=1796922 RepID=UPI001F0C329E
MPTIAQAAQGVVTALWGRALIRNADGTMRELKVGDRVQRGDQILTTQDGIVQIDPDDGSATATAAKPKEAPAQSELEQVITGLNRGDAGTAPGAGLAGGGDGSLQEGLRVERIAENLTGGNGPGSGSQAVPRVEFVNGAAGATREASSSDGAPSITVDAPALTNDSTPTITGTTNLPAGATVGLVVTDADGVQQTVLATVQPGGTYSVDVPSPLAEGNYAVVATATDAAGNAASANDTGAIDLTAPSITVDAPALTSDATPTITGTTNLPAGSTVSLVVTDSNGVAQTLSATVQPGGTYSVEVPSPLAEGNYSVVATAVDAAGNAATANDAGAIDLTAPNVTVDAPALTNDSTPTITGTTNLPAGSTVSLVVTDANGVAQTLSATVQPGGTYSVDVPNPLAEGSYTVVATATDAAGNAASADDAGAIDLTAPSITVDAPALTNDATPTITGTTNLPAGAAVSLVVTDANGVQQTVLATVQPGGTYSVDVPSPLAEGNYSVVASATDAAGNAASANDVGAIDLTAPSVTVDAPALTNDSTPTITGTTNLPAGSTVSLVVTDANGVQQTVLATVQPGGTYSVDVPSALAEGSYSVVATATDAAGNSANANDAGAIDLTAPSISVDAPALTNDATPTITGTTNLPAGATVSLVVTDANGVQQTVLATVAEGNYSVVATATDAAGNSANANDAGAIDLTAPSITVDAPALTNDSTPTITGTTNLPAGSTVSLVVTDANGVQQTVLATVQPGGTYSVDVPTPLAEGNYSVVATGIDAAGNAASANDTGAIDLTAPSITVDAPALTNDATPTITGTTNLPAGSTVSLVVTDANGVQQTVLATVQPGGTYSVDVSSPLAEGNFSVVATATDAAGNSANANDTGAIDLTAPSITVDAPALTNDATPTITGTTNLPAGSTVSLVVTDANGVQQSVLATVQPGGTYSVDVPSPL